MSKRYLEYLCSEEWQVLRNKVLTRSGNGCELCGRSAVDIHHIKYPKDLEKDSMKNLLAVCKNCHDKLHGKAKLINYEQLFYKMLRDLMEYLEEENRVKTLPELKDLYNKYVEEYYNG